MVNQISNATRNTKEVKPLFANEEIEDVLFAISENAHCQLGRQLHLVELNRY